MRRAVLTLGSTAAGLAVLFSYKSHSPTAAAYVPSPAPSTPGTSAQASTGMAGGTGSTTAADGAGRASSKQPAAGSATKTAAGSATKTAAGSATKAAAGSATTTRMVTGKVADTQYGPMQVEITLTGKRITQVTVLQQTDFGALSQSIDSMAIPKLTAETLAAQSARIDAVSGASYTSSGYIQSLQSAIDQAGV